ncbi:MAG: 3'-5' exonuclease [Patescibacteria group bacterium]
MDFNKRPLAITDVETTGLDVRRHEIIDIGLLVVEQSDLNIIKYSLDYKVKPEHPETAEAEALKINGYNEADWRDAPNLKSVMKLYAELTKDAVFLASPVSFDWQFVEEAFRKTGVKDPMDYHRLDLFSIAWGKQREGKLPGVKSLKLSELCKFFGIPEEPMPHVGINGATIELEILRKLLAL